MTDSNPALAATGADESSADGAERDIAAAVRNAAEALLAATLRGDADAVINAYLPEASIAEQGAVTSRVDSLAVGIREFYSTHHVTANALDVVSVRPLGPNAAVLTARYAFAAIRQDGHRLGSAGAWTAVFVRRAGTWRIAAAHQSNAAGSGDATPPAE